MAYARRNPTHPVWIIHKGGRRAVSWEVVPADGNEAYRLAFNLPAHLDSWIADSEHERADEAPAPSSCTASPARHRGVPPAVLAAPAELTRP
ncbi:hypothetical protein ACFQX7_36780 [Luedemannella flava]